MNLRNMTLIGLTALATLAATTADARRYYSRYDGYGAYARYSPSGRYYSPARSYPSGPASMRFELGSGWNNGSLPPSQYGRPDQW